MVMWNVLPGVPLAPGSSGEKHRNEPKGKRGEEEMKRTRLHLLLCGALAVVTPALAAAPRQAIGTAVGAGPIRIDDVILPSGAVFYSGDRISTSSAEASLHFAKGDELTLGLSTSVRVRRSRKAFVVQLEQGKISVFNEGQSRTVVRVNGITIESQKTSGSYDVAYTDKRLRVVTRSGVTLVVGANRSVTVPAGSLLRTTVRPGSTNWKAGKLLVVTVIAGAATAGAILGVAASSPAPSCVSSSQLSCP